MRSFSILVLGLLVVSLFAQGALAATLTCKEAGVQIAVPEGWKSAQEAEMISVTSPDATMAVVFLVLPEEVADKAFAEIEKHMEKETGKIAWEEKPTHEKINGMATEIWNGTAKDGKLQVEALYIDTPTGKSLGIYWFDTKESESKYAKEIDLMVKGLKPIGDAAPASAAPASAAPASAAPASPAPAASPADKE